MKDFPGNWDPKKCPLCERLKCICNRKSNEERIKELEEENQKLKKENSKFKNILDNICSCCQSNPGRI
jgi:translation elongation factor EF-1alpha